MAEGALYSKIIACAFYSPFQTRKSVITLVSFALSRLIILSVYSSSFGGHVSNVVSNFVHCWGTNY